MTSRRHQQPPTPSQPVEPHWKCWRLLTLETRMGSCRRNSQRGSPRQVGTALRRRPPVRDGPTLRAELAASTGTIQRVATSWGTGGVGALNGCARPTSTRVTHRGLHPSRQTQDPRARSGAGELRAQAPTRSRKRAAASGRTRPPTGNEIVAFIDAHRADFGVEPICTVQRSGCGGPEHYAAKTRQPSAREPVTPR